MRYEEISIEICAQETSESNVAFLKRLNQELKAIQQRENVASVIPFPTQSVTGLWTYSFMIMTRIPEPPPRTDDNFHCGDELDGGPGERCKQQCRQCVGDKITK